MQNHILRSIVPRLRVKTHTVNAIVVILFALGTTAAFSQTVTDCPHPNGCVVISVEAARKALETSDALEAEKKLTAAKDVAINDLKNELDQMRLELAKAIGEKTGNEQMVVRLTAIIDFMLKNGRTKKYGLINF